MDDSVKSASRQSIQAKGVKDEQMSALVH